MKGVLSEKRIPKVFFCSFWHKAVMITMRISYQNSTGEFRKKKLLLWKLFLTD